MFYRKVRDGKAILPSQLQVKVPSEQIPQEDQINEQVNDGSDLTHDDQQIPREDQIQGSRAIATQRPSKRNKLPRQQEPQQFHQGDVVRVQDPASHRWNLTARATGFSQTGRTLEVLTEDGSFIRRNRRMVRLKCVA